MAQRYFETIRNRIYVAPSRRSKRILTPWGMGSDPQRTASRYTKTMATEIELQFLQDNLNFLFGLFVIFEELRTNQTIDISLKKILVSGLARSYIGGLASLTDPTKDKLGNENLSIYLIPETNLSSHDLVIGKLKDVRNKIIAHNDKAAMLKGDDFLKDMNLTIEDSKALLYQLADIVGKASGRSMPVETMKSEYTTSLRKALRR